MSTVRTCIRWWGRWRLRQRVAPLRPCAWWTRSGAGDRAGRSRSRRRTWRRGPGSHHGLRQSWILFISLCLNDLIKNSNQEKYKIIVNINYWLVRDNSHKGHMYLECPHLDGWRVRQNCPMNSELKKWRTTNRTNGRLLYWKPSGRI